ncbi:MAG: TIGR02757 family protein [Bacteroidetes bacterium]|nr:TIGR02757 family protein [Bacteroidota bacterium]
MYKTLKQKLDYHYKAFDKSQLEPDPLQFPHKFKNKKDIELIAFISSIFAYGNIKQIINTLNKITFILGEHPTNYLIEKNKATIKRDFKGIIHRFFTNEDIVNLILLLKNVYSKSNSLGNIFLSNYNTKVYNIKFALESFSKYMLELYQNLFGEENVTQGIKFMFPLPSKGSVCKRMNLFLRWMVRKDELDFGLWDEIDKSKLIIPVDTHIARICRKLKLTKKKNINWNMAEEITENLKKYDPDDPVKYDFAICHIGMRKLRF